MVLFFDLFFTLIEPAYYNSFNENDVLNITVKEWESIAEDQELYLRRAIGKVQNINEIINEIIVKGGFTASLTEKKQLLELRVNRMSAALQNVDGKILNTLSELKEMGFKLCIISNADVIDKIGWKESPLYQLFDFAVFSCDVGSIKPQPHIYQIAMEKMNVNSKDSYFIGDGGSDELYGAKSLGMKTVLSEHLLKRTNHELKQLLSYADFYIKDFTELLQIPY